MRGGGGSSLRDPGAPAPGCLFQSDVLFFGDVLTGNEPRRAGASVRSRGGRICPQMPVSNWGARDCGGCQWLRSKLDFNLYFKKEPILPSQVRTKPRSRWGRPREGRSQRGREPAGSGGHPGLLAPRALRSLQVPGIGAQEPPDQLFCQHPSSRWGVWDRQCGSSSEISRGAARPCPRHPALHALCFASPSRGLSGARGVACAARGRACPVTAVTCVPVNTLWPPWPNAWHAGEEAGAHAPHGLNSSRN